jgi:adenine-specific DNA-methyltransferase
MKYMGSKRSMLSGQLGAALASHIPARGGRFADLFSGSGAVSWHIAESQPVPVIATDIQEYARVLSAAVVSRTSKQNSEALWDDWVSQAIAWLKQQDHYWVALSAHHQYWERRPKGGVADIRKLCQGMASPVACAYGGHYYSPMQALILDSLRATVPKDSFHRDVQIASLVIAAAECAASPGHTAQPFQPTSTAGRFLFEAWRRDVWAYSRRAFFDLGCRHAKKKGSAQVASAIEGARTLGEKDVAFVDPPYSGVHYSRFYHVLETVAQGKFVSAEGVGRYPDRSDRPQSDFSVRTKSNAALKSLLKELSGRGTTTIITYPAQECSNGLSGAAVEEMASELFKVKKIGNASTFSTLGGNGTHRAARKQVDELILVCSAP